jgi:hypothetical protein
MPTCRRMTEMASDRLDGSLGLLARLAFDRHLARCDHCRAHLRMLEATRLALSRLPQPDVPPDLGAALLSRFEAWAAALAAAPRREGGRLAVWPLLATAAVLLVLLVPGEARSAATRDWIAGAGLGAVALALAAGAGRLRAAALGAAPAAMIVAALVESHGGGLAADAGLQCLLTELGGALVVASAARAGARRAAEPAPRRALLGGAVAGALAGAAALQVTCAAREALPHLLAFHAGGVLAAAAVAALLLRWPPPAPG